MTQPNVKHGCITFEEPGEVVHQGRGHTRIYPFKGYSWSAFPTAFTFASIFLSINIHETINYIR